MKDLMDATHAFKEVKPNLKYDDSTVVNCERYRRADMTEIEWKNHSDMQQ